MKKHLFSLVVLFGSISVSAQQDFFALAGKDSQKIEFSDFRAMNSDGTSGTQIFNVDSQSDVFSQTSRSKITEDKNAYGNAQAMNLAALATDLSQENLVYMPMFSSNIYVLNQKTKQITLVENTVARVTACDINSHITRMTLGYDGSFYAMNNSGTQLLQISKKNNQYSVADLGIVKDATSNGKNSFTSMETGFGGDMIADAEGNFYVFSAAGNVFKVSPKNLEAYFLGKISGLPENYSVNGAAVNSKGKIVVASAKGNALYEVNFETLEAKQLAGETNLHIYDLASKYFLNDRKAVEIQAITAEIYPTRIDENFIFVNLNQAKIKGNIKVDIFDLSGKNVLSKILSVKDGNLNERVELSNLSQGAYLVSVSDNSGKVISTKKVLKTR
ncbi:T9SS type A sorting domain-containing protein [Chryseobacterium sp.]|uniref:T9SS type A sorting domain-containing protein n=1 Tax=Chryseobacterium sp. TaxID=1871047 RepID=UPI0028992D2F|nr:T9SS type A sorting domain-containing protein [Chryseobacterium sp.]